MTKHEVTIKGVKYIYIIDRTIKLGCKDCDLEYDTKFGCFLDGYKLGIPDDVESCINSESGAYKKLSTIRKNKIRNIFNDEY